MSQRSLGPFYWVKKSTVSSKHKCHSAFNISPKKDFKPRVKYNLNHYLSTSFCILDAKLLLILYHLYQIKFPYSASCYRIRLWACLTEFSKTHINSTSCCAVNFTALIQSAFLYPVIELVTKYLWSGTPKRGLSAHVFFLLLILITGPVQKFFRSTSFFGINSFVLPDPLILLDLDLIR